MSSAAAAVRTWYLPAPCTALAWLPRSQLQFAASLAAPLPSIRLYSLAPRPALLSSQPSATPEPHLVSSIPTASALLLRSLLLDNASLIVSASSSGHVSIHSGTDLQVHTSAKVYHSAVSALAAAPSGIASAGIDGSLHLHPVSALNGAPLASYTDAAGSVTSLAWVSPHLIAACGAGANVSLLDVRAKLTAQRLIDTARQAAFQLCVAAVPAAQHTLVSGAADGRLTLWDARQNRSPVRSVSGQHTGSVFGLLCHPLRANTVFSCGADHRLLAWCWDGQADDCTQQFQADSALIALDYDPELQLLLTSSEGHGLFAVQPTL